MCVCVCVTVFCSFVYECVEEVKSDLIPQLNDVTLALSPVVGF